MQSNSHFKFVSTESIYLNRKFEHTNYFAAALEFNSIIYFHKHKFVNKSCPLPLLHSFKSLQPDSEKKKKKRKRHLLGLFNLMLGILKRTLHRLFTMSHNENPVVPVKRVRREHNKADESGRVMFVSHPCKNLKGLIYF